MPPHTASPSSIHKTTPCAPISQKRSRTVSMPPPRANGTHGEMTTHIAIWIVARRSPTIDAFSRTQTIDFINETATTLLPGQSGRLELFAPAENTWFDVPRHALTVLDDQNVLFVDLPDHDLPEPALEIGRAPRRQGQY